MTLTVVLNVFNLNTFVKLYRNKQFANLHNYAASVQNLMSVILIRSLLLRIAFDNSNLMRLLDCLYIECL